MHVVPAGPAGAHLRVLARHAAEGDEQPCVRRQRPPIGVVGHETVHGVDDVRHDHPPGAQAVGVVVPHVPANAVQEAVQLALRVVKAPRAGPTVRATEEGLVTLLLAHAAQLTSHQLQGPVPGHLHERLTASQRRTCAWALLKPAAPHRRGSHAGPLPVGLQHGQADGGGVRVLGQCGQRAHRAIGARTPYQLVSAPVGSREFAGSKGHDGILQSKRLCAAPLVRPGAPLSGAPVGRGRMDSDLPLVACQKTLFSFGWHRLVGVVRLLPSDRWCEPPGPAEFSPEPAPPRATPRSSPALRCVPWTTSGLWGYTGCGWGR